MALAVIGCRPVTAGDRSGLTGTRYDTLVGRQGGLSPPVTLNGNTPWSLPHWGLTPGCGGKPPSRRSVPTTVNHVPEVLWSQPGFISAALYIGANTSMVHVGDVAASVAARVYSAMSVSVCRLLLSV